MIDLESLDINYDELTEIEQDYYNLIEVCQNFQEVYCEKDIPHFEHIIKDINLDEMNFPLLFIEALEFDNFSLSEIFFNKGIDINDEYIVGLFIEYCIHDEKTLVNRLLEKGLNLTNNLIKRIEFKFKNTSCGNTNDTFEYVKLKKNEYRLKKISNFKKRISNLFKFKN